MEEIIYFTDSENLPQYLTQQDYLSNFRTQLYHKQDQRFINTTFSKNLIKKRKQKPQILKGIITKFKTDRLVKNFCKKIKRIIPNRKPIQYKLNKQSSNFFYWNFIENKQGLEISDKHMITITLMSIIMNTILTVFFSLKIVFEEIPQNYYMKIIQQISLVFFLIDMLIKFIFKSNYDNKRLVYINEISYHYFTHNFSIDLINILLLVQQIFYYSQLIEINLLHLLAIVKLIRQVIDLEMLLEKNFITNFKREQIADLITVLLINFSFAHILAILLNAMIFINNNHNWIIEHNLKNSSWYQKYAWGYYWGTTIMFTVGFGDFAASNYQQAICITFIEMFSCIILTYNINCIGNIINNLRSNNVVKNKRFKTFYQMNKNKKISLELEKKIQNYIEGCCLIKKDFNFADQNQLLQSLSTNLKTKYLQESQKTLFENLPQLKNWTNKMKTLLAQKIKKLITHPESIIQQKGEISKLLILEKGEIALMFNEIGNKKKQYQIEIIKSNSLEEAKMINLDFIKGKRLTHQIKALTYSILYYFENQDLLDILKDNPLDFQNFCMGRDRQQYILNENEIIKCQFCVDQYHTKFKCPKIHYIPIKNIVIDKYNILKKQQIQKRANIIRKRRKSKYTKITHDQKQYLKYFNSEKALDSQNFYRSIVTQKSESKITIKNIIISQNQQESNVGVNEIQDILSKYLVVNNGNIQQSFWNLQCDEVHDWKYYFCEYNPMNLIKNIKLKTKKK